MNGGGVEEFDADGLGEHAGQLLHRPFAFLLDRPDGFGLAHQADQPLSDVENSSVDVGRFVRGQPRDEGRDVFPLAPESGGAGARAADAPCGSKVSGFVRHGLGHPGSRAGRYGVGCDTVSSHVSGDDAGEAGDAVLGRAVVGLAGVAVQTRGGSKRDYPARTLLPVENAGVLDHGESAPEVDGDHVVPLLFGHVEYHPVSEDAGAGDHDVQLAEVVNGGLDYVLASGHGDNRVGVGHGLAPRGLDLRDHAFGQGVVRAGAVDIHSGVDHHYLRALFSHKLGDAGADAPARAGDDRYFAF